MVKEVHADVKKRMEKVVADFQGHLAATRTGRASAHMLDNVRVDYYGSQTPVSQLGQVSVPEPHLILIQPWDPSVLAEIEKALRSPEFGFNPQSDGKAIRLPIPPMTEERRRDVVKQVNKELEDHRTAVRNVRRDGNDALKKLTKDKLISEDDEKRAQEEIQKLTDGEIKRMEELAKKKEVEIMQV